MRHLPILPILFALLAITACTDDLGLTGPGAVTRDIRFNATVGDQWGKASRAGEIATPIAPGFEKVTAYQRFEMKSTTSDRPLYLHSETTDWDSPATPDTLPSRSNVITNPINLPSKIAVSAYHYTGDWTAASPTADPNFVKWHPANGTNGSYTFSPSLYWPSEGKMRFLAYGPADAPEIERWPTTWGHGPMLIANVHPTDISKHRDIVIAYTPERECTGSDLPVNLHFKHIMTGIRFKIADDMVSCRIKRIVFKNAIRKGRFFFNHIYDAPLLADPAGASSPTSQIGGMGVGWYAEGDGNRGDVEQTLDYDTSTAVDPTINPDSKTFMMIPQVIGDAEGKNPKIEVQIYLVQNIGGQDTEELIYGYIQNQTWSPGKIVTYTVSYRNWGGSMRISEPEIFSHKGGSATLSMRNYIYAGTDNKEKRPVKWKATYCPSGTSTYSDVPPEWLEINYNNTVINSTNERHFEGVGSIEEENFKVTVAPTPVSRTYDLDKILYETPGQPKNNPLNLACHSDSLNDFTLYPWNVDHSLSGSANCYICDRPGYYMFPLVYGNSIKEGGGENYDSFRDPSLPAGSTLIEENGVIHQIINHEGKPITSPYINKVVDMSDLSKFHGEVVWEDRPSLVNDIEIVPNAYGTGKHGVRFCVVRDPEYTNGWWLDGASIDRVQQGNAVIAIKDYRAYDNLEDAGYEEVPAVWSWHIWVTPILNYERHTVRIHNHLNRRFDMLPVNIGWVSYNPIEFYDPRSCKIRFTGTFEGQDEVGNPKTHTIEREITIEQRRCFHYWHGHSTFYQWGRKDPFQGGRYMQAEGSTIRGTNVFWWSRDCSYCDGVWDEYISMHKDQNPPTKLFPVGLEGLTQRIRFPNSWDSTEDIFDPGSTLPKGLDKVPFNLWDAENRTGYLPPTGSLPVVEIHAKKTVYDPSPRGFKVPPISAFTGFTKTGNNVITADGTADEFQAWNGNVEEYTYTYDDTRYYDGGSKVTLTSHVAVLFTDRTKRNVITIPMQGYRDWRRYPSVMGGDESSALYQLGTDAYLWTSQCYTQDRSYYASFMYGRTGAGHKGEIFPLNYYWHLDGFNVRPCTEVYYPVPVQ